jgi:hypothetical protein
MNSIKVFVEIGKKRVFAGAVDWPGWCRSGRDEKTALQALIDYGPRYAQVLRSKEIEFQVPIDASDLIVTERMRLTSGERLEIHELASKERMLNESFAFVAA